MSKVEHYKNYFLHAYDIEKLKTIIKDKDSRGLPNTPIPPDQVSIAGGFFLSNRDNLTWWHETYYSQLFNYLKNGYKYRSIINVSFTETLKNKFNEALLISSNYGIPQLNKERINGSTRLTANWESVWYNGKSFYGFKTSPFAFVNISYLRTVGQPIIDGDIYSSIGSGMRLRNESLIFGTIELKAFYFPRTNLQLSPWNLSLTTNIRYKYSSSIISKPDFVQIN